MKKYHNLLCFVKSAEGMLRVLCSGSGNSCKGNAVSCRNISNNVFNRAVGLCSDSEHAAGRIPTVKQVFTIAHSLHQVA